MTPAEARRVSEPPAHARERAWRRLVADGNASSPPAERRQRAERVVDEALRLSPWAQADVLLRLEAEDPELAELVTRLLEATAADEEAPAPAPAADPAPVLVRTASRRGGLVVGTALALVVSILALLAGALAFRNARLTRERDAAVAERDAAERARDASRAELEAGRRVGPDPELLRMGTLLAEVGSSLEGKRAAPQAERLLLDSLALRERWLGPDDPAVADSLGRLAGHYERAGRPLDGLEVQERALAITSRALGPEAPALVPALARLGDLHRRAGHPAEAKRRYLESIKLAEKLGGPGHASAASGLHGLACLARNAGDVAGAEAMFRRTLALLPAGDPLVAETRAELASLAASRSAAPSADQGP